MEGGGAVALHTGWAEKGRRSSEEPGPGATQVARNSLCVSSSLPPRPPFLMCSATSFCSAITATWSCCALQQQSSPPLPHLALPPLAQTCSVTSSASGAHSSPSSVSRSSATAYSMVPGAGGVEEQVQHSREAGDSEVSRGGRTGCAGGWMIQHGKHAFQTKLPAHPRKGSEARILPATHRPCSQKGLHLRRAHLSCRTARSSPQTCRAPARRCWSCRSCSAA